MSFFKPILVSLVFLASCAPQQSSAPPASGQSASLSAALLSKTSPDSFDETVARLRAGIEKRPLTLFAEIDHAKGAASADLTLAPSTLFIFGNPKGGSPLMARNPKFGIVLPLKMHVYETDDVVTISYVDMAETAKRYGLDPAAQPVPNITEMLEGLAAEAAGK